MVSGRGTGSSTNLAVTFALVAGIVVAVAELVLREVGSAAGRTPLVLLEDVLRDLTPLELSGWAVLGPVVVVAFLAGALMEFIAGPPRR